MAHMAYVCRIIENDLTDENDLFHFSHYKSGELDTLCRETHFTRKEIRRMYRGFKQECPSGVCSEKALKNIFAQYFQGDATQYAHYVFLTFKNSSAEGVLNFEQFLTMLSSISRGSLAEKLRWIFSLYDVDGDGFISKSEMLLIVTAIYDLIGNLPTAAAEHVEHIFHQIDSDQDGLICYAEFTDWCIKDEERARSLSIFDTVGL